MTSSSAEKQPLLAGSEQPPIQIRLARLTDAHQLASLTLQSFKGAPFWDWVRPASSFLLLCSVSDPALLS